MPYSVLKVPLNPNQPTFWPWRYTQSAQAWITQFYLQITPLPCLTKCRIPNANDLEWPSKVILAATSNLSGEITWNYSIRCKTSSTKLITAIELHYVFTNGSVCHIRKWDLWQTVQRHLKSGRLIHKRGIACLDNSRPTVWIIWEDYRNL